VRYGSIDYKMAKWSPIGRFGFWISEWQLRFADAVIAVTPALRESLVSRGFRVRIEVIPNALDPVEVEPDAASIHPSAIVHPGAVIGPGTVVGPYVTIGPNVRIGRNCRIGASCAIDGWTEIGDDNVLYPLGSYGMAPQDLKYKGERTRLVIGNRNIFREFVTVHRGTVTGRGVTTIGDRNYLMAYAHVAHDCVIGNDTILSHGTTLGGHVDIEDFATLGGYVGIHQFCRVGTYAFIGGFSACTKDVLPYSKTVGNRALIYGLNTIGLARRGFSQETIRKLKQAYRYLLVKKLNTTRALEHIEADPSLDCPEVRTLVVFIRNAKRGVVLKRPVRRGAPTPPTHPPTTTPGPFRPPARQSGHRRHS
jgi:UDP-N-acetylglucosamine acyltransferase